MLKSDVYRGSDRYAFRLSFSLFKAVSAQVDLELTLKLAKMGFEMFQNSGILGTYIASASRQIGLM